MGHRASQGLFNGGRRLFGYSIVEKELVPYPKEKQIVEIVFHKTQLELQFKALPWPITIPLEDTP